MSKFLIVGLGNIGAEYANTRHNIGFKVVDEIAQNASAKFKTDRLADMCEIKRGLKYPIEPAQLAELFSKLGLITPTNQPEIRYKEVFELALQNPEMKDSIYNPQEIEKLKEIAQLCPFIEGNAVYMARVILHAFEPERNYMNSCEFAKNPERKSSERKANNSGTAINEFNYDSNIIVNEYLLSPNPNNGICKLKCPNNSSLIYELADVSGKINFSGFIKPSDNSFEFNFSGISKGIYSLKLISENNSKIIKMVIY